jgi:anti-anti-sigma factor
LIVTLIKNLGEFEYDHIEEEARRLRKLWEASDARNIIVDFHRTDYCGSRALGLLVELNNQVQSRQGQFLFCGVSDHEKEILKVTGLNHLDHLWLDCPSREKALEFIRQQSADRQPSVNPEQGNG